MFSAFLRHALCGFSFASAPRLCLSAFPCYPRRAILFLVLSVRSLIGSRSAFCLACTFGLDFLPAMPCQMCVCERESNRNTGKGKSKQEKEIFLVIAAREGSRRARGSKTERRESVEQRKEERRSEKEEEQEERNIASTLPVESDVFFDSSFSSSIFVLCTSLISMTSNPVDKEAVLSVIRNDTCGASFTFNTPFGERQLLYAGML